MPTRPALILAVLVLAWGGWHWHGSRALRWPPGHIVDTVPRQTPTDAAPFEQQGFRLTPLAAFELDARALATERYRLDAGAALAPLDVAFGWGRMSDQSVIDRLDIRQGARFYTWSYQDPPPLAPAGIARSSANLHLIPADAGVERQLLAIRPGQRVRLGGLLIEAAGADGFRWRSSLSREDSGDGACELVWVEWVESAEPP